MRQARFAPASTGVSVHVAFWLNPGIFRYCFSIIVQSSSKVKRSAGSLCRCTLAYPDAWCSPGFRVSNTPHRSWAFIRERAEHIVTGTTGYTRFT